ncbi:uncharacterized protein Dwil_GK10311 [Drosophila willistoni]|uniref:Protein TsetseEP domain-containing protein n=1 Tax=Drosophila willistoni TaxID=7260 RepID=B4MJ35_DROWI|nr:uncharacterized protein LOC6638035 [Drosophila willistoni]EDW72124.1 uncharacterized protein Dwil_GK10311 [Drosophila willistoni]
MFSKVFTFLLLALVGSILATQRSAEPMGMADNLKLMDLMMRQSRSGENIECFPVYLPILQEIDTQYKIDYTKCWSDRQSGASGIEELYTIPRDNLSSNAKNICGPLLECEQKEGSSQLVFECYEKTGTEKSTPLNNLTLDGAQLAREIAEDFRRIDIIAEACYGSAYRTYSNDRNEAESSLEYCLSNGV